MNHVVLFWVSGCESWWIMLWRLVVNHEVQPVCSAHWLGIMVFCVKPSGCELWCIMLRKVVVNCATGMLSPMVGSHGVVCRPSGCESWFVMLSQWLWIMVNYAEPVVMNHGVLYWASSCKSCWGSGSESWCVWWDSGCDSWIVMLCQMLWIMFCYAEPVVVNHVGLCWAIGF